MVVKTCGQNMHLIDMLSTLMGGDCESWFSSSPRVVLVSESLSRSCKSSKPFALEMT